MYSWPAVAEVWSQLVQNVDSFWLITFGTWLIVVVTYWTVGFVALLTLDLNHLPKSWFRCVTVFAH